jgi:hypothetical protein
MARSKKPKPPEVVPDKTVFSFGSVDVMVRAASDPGDPIEVYLYDATDAVYYMVDSAALYTTACIKAKRHALSKLKELDGKPDA